MTKNFKLVLALALVALMMATMVPAFAANLTITVNDSTTISTATNPTAHRANHVYTVYQVFTGDVETVDGELLLKNVQYGSDYTGHTGAVDQADLEAITDARAFATSWLANPHGAGIEVDADDNFQAEVAPGYYIIVDSSNPLATGDALSANMVKIIGDTTIVPKKSTVTDTKEIVTDGLGTTETNETPEDNRKVDDVSIGDIVNYKITATVPAEAIYYNYFYFVINDTMEETLTLKNPANFVVKAGETALTEGTDYELHAGTYVAPVEPNMIGRTTPLANGKTFEIGLKDAKAHAGETITVEFSAYLNEDADLGEDPNDNTSTVTYSNNPEYDYDGKNNPSFPAEKDKDALGVTPVTETHTYTIEVKIIKVDQDGNPLTGAEFTIAGNTIEKVVVKKETFTVGTGADATYYKLKNGTYTTDEPSTADTMELKGTSTATSEGYVVDSTYAGDDKQVINGVTYRPFAPATDVGKQYYVLQHGNGYLYDSTETKYVKGESIEVVDGAANSYSVAKEVDANGVVEFVGLGAGEYTITESKVPDGYNAVEPMTLDVDFTYNPAENAPHWTVGANDTADSTYDKDTGTFSITVENQKGTLLPETGGVGTTIFYVAGSIMVLAAAILLITKRRMGAND